MNNRQTDKLKGVVGVKNMNALIVIDMQEDYVGQNRNKKRYPYISEQLVDNINLRIVDYKRNNDMVIHVNNLLYFDSTTGVNAAIERKIYKKQCETEEVSSFEGGKHSNTINLLYGLSVF